jgi:hypothetical protein
MDNVYIDPIFEFILLNERSEICTCTDMGSTPTGV